jgi:hypothetical protein
VLAALVGAVLAVGAPATTRIDCALDVDARTIRGDVTFELANPTDEPLTRAYVWLYPNRFRDPPAGLDDVNFYWVYPRRFDAGWMKLTAPAGDARAEAHGAAGRGVLWSVELAEPIAPGERGAIAMSYEARIPEQYGSFGCVGDGCSLAGGFYPMLAAIDGGGWDLTAPPQRTDVTVELTLAEPASVVLDGALFGEPDGDRVSSVKGTTPDIAYASLFVAPRWYATSREVGDVSLRLLSRSEPPPAEDARRKILPYTLEPYAEYAADAGERALELLAEAGIEPTASSLAIVQAPTRTGLAESHPTAVVVSDRWYRIWPAKRFRKFHDRQLARALFGTVLAARLRAQGGTPARDVFVAADMAASYLTDLYTVEQYRRQESAADILQPVRFLPVIDQVLYAPQLMFADAYFGTIVEDETLLSDPKRFADTRPRGRLYYEKLRDLLEPEALSDAMHAITVDGVPMRAAAEAAYGGSLGWFFRQWSLPYPRVNYRLGALRSERAAGGGYVHELEISKDVAAGDEPPVEPVEIVVIDDAGNDHELRWDGRGDRAVLRFETASPVAVLSLDPNRRLAETRLSDADNHELFDNRRPSRTRFVYNSLGVLFNVSDFSAVLAADFTLARVHDLRNRTRFLVYTSSATTFGASATYNRLFGPRTTDDSLLSGVSVRLAGARLRAGALEGDDLAASRAGLRLGIASSDQIFVFEPLHTRGIAASVEGTATRVDADGDAGADVLLAGSATAGYTRIETPWGGHTFAVNAGAAAAFGDIQQSSQRLSGGGVGGSRGFGPFELFGLTRFELHAEWRHAYVHDLDWNFGHYNFVRGIGGVLFADAIALSRSDSHDPFEGDVYPTVGYGVQLFYDSFGTIQQMMRIDVALRLDSELTSAVPAVYLSFVPPF